MKKQTKVYIISIAIPLLVGGLSALITAGNMDVYKELIQPPLAPPGWLFPVVWTILYVLMGISAARVHLSDAPQRIKEHGLYSYGISLLMNFMWSIIFFNVRAFLFAFFWILGLLFFVIRTIYYYFKADRLAAKLQIPYALWVTFATYLNFAIWALN